MQTTDRRLRWVGFKPTGDLAGLTCYTSKKRQVVWFIKSPPKVAPSLLQIRHRRLFGAAALAWSSLSSDVRERWTLAARRSRLFLTGYTLFMVWTLTPDRGTIRTIERITGIQLVN